VSHQDDVFMRMFGIVLGVLILLAFIVFFIAQNVTSDQPNSSMSEQAIEKRIAPVGKLKTGEEKPMAAAETTVASTGGAASAVPAACAACHGTGVLGAPKIGNKADWEPRLAQGMDVLIASASKGKGNMPPQGATFSNDALKEAIQAMLSKSGL
jgi:cytochrome c5